MVSFIVASQSTIDIVHNGTFILNHLIIFIRRFITVKNRQFGRWKETSKSAVHRTYEFICNYYVWPTNGKTQRKEMGHYLTMPYWLHKDFLLESRNTWTQFRIELTKNNIKLRCTTAIWLHSVNTTATVANILPSPVLDLLDRLQRIYQTQYNTP